MPHKPLKPLDQVVRELGRYPLGAFLFIQECVGMAADEVHGAFSPEQANVAQWMTRHEINPDELRRLEEDGHLPPDIMRALRKMGGAERMNRHVTGQQLCWAIRSCALKRWGLMARGVLSRWNIRTTDDIGQIIFALVENDWLQKQPTDSIDDFRSVFCFEDAFEEDYHIGVS